MGFVKTPDEIARIEHALSHPRFVNGEMLIIDFLSDPDTSRRYPAAAARAGRHAHAHRDDRPLAVQLRGDFYGGAIYVAARHEGIEGGYVLAMYMDDDVPDDLRPRPVRRAQEAGPQRAPPQRRPVQRLARAQRRGDHGAARRRARGPRPERGRGRELQLQGAPGGERHRAEEDAILTRATFQSIVRVAPHRHGTLTLRGTVHDPLDEIPVVSIVGARFVECDLIARARRWPRCRRTCSSYHHGRHDDWSALDTESAALRRRDQLSAPMDSAIVAGVGMTKFAKSTRALRELAGEAVRERSTTPASPVDAVEAAYVGNAVAGLVTGQEMIRGQVMLRPLGIEGIPIFNVENACASASSAFHLGWQAVAAGACDVALCLGAEKLTHEDKTVGMAAIGTAVDVELQAEMAAALGAGGDDGGKRSFFMDIYAGDGARLHGAARARPRATSPRWW